MLESLRSVRVAGLSLFDIVLTVVIGVYVGEYLGYKDRELVLFVGALIPLGVATHWLLGVKTPLNDEIGLETTFPGA